MIKRITKVVGQVLEGAGSIVGIRSGTEEPQYTSEPLASGVEIRRYGPRIAAETTVFDDLKADTETDAQAALSTGFRRLARYIFGGNHQQAKIAMTAPVAQQKGEKIAMTAPVAQARGAGGGSVIRFYMPAEWSMQTLPTPDSSAVTLVTVPPETFAVLRFTGDRGPGAIAENVDRLLNTLRDYGFEQNGEPVSWFYDPPWTIPFRRRNEVAVPVKK